MFKNLPLVPTTVNDPAKWLTPRSSNFLTWAVNFPKFLNTVFCQIFTFETRHLSLFLSVVNFHSGGNSEIIKRCEFYLTYLVLNNIFKIKSFFLSLLITYHLLLLTDILFTNYQVMIPVGAWWLLSNSHYCLLMMICND